MSVGFCNYESINSFCQFCLTIDGTGRCSSIEFKDVAGASLLVGAWNCFSLSVVVCPRTHPASSGGQAATLHLCVLWGWFPGCLRARPAYPGGPVGICGRCLPHAVRAVRQKRLLPRPQRYLGTGPVVLSLSLLQDMHPATCTYVQWRAPVPLTGRGGRGALSLLYKSHASP